jgi:hypothetical protein
VVGQGGEARRGSAQAREGCGVQRVCAPENVPVTIDRPGFDSNRAFRSAMCHSEIGVTTYESVPLSCGPDSCRHLGGRAEEGTSKKVPAMAELSWEVAMSSSPTKAEMTVTTIAWKSCAQTATCPKPRRVPQGTAEYLRAPQSTAEYRRVPLGYQLARPHHKGHRVGAKS